MNNITIKEGNNRDNAVFEKTGITMEFSLNEIDTFIEDLEVQKGKVTTKILLVEQQLDKIEKPNLSNLDESKYAIFTKFARYKNQINLALSELSLIIEKNEDFNDIYEQLDNKEETPKYLSFKEELKVLAKEFEAIDAELDKYNKDKTEAESCLK